MKVFSFANLISRISLYIQDKTKLDIEFLKKNLFWVNFQLIGVRAIKLVYSVILIRLVSKEFYGNFNYINSAFLLLGFFSLSGFGISVARALANNLFGTFKSWLRMGLYWSILGSIILVGLGLYNLHTGREHTYVFILLAPLFPLYFFFNRWSVLLESIGRFRKLSIFNVSKAFVLSLGNLLLLLLFREDLVVFVVGSTALFILAGIYYHRKSQIYIINDAIEPGWKKSGYKLTLNNLFEYAYGTLDKIFLYGMMGPEGVAIYSVSIIWPENIKTILSSNLMVYLPKIFRVSNEHYLDKVRQSATIIAVISLASLIISLLFIPVFILILYGTRYVESIPYALVQSLVIPLHFLQVFSNKALLKLKKEEYLSISHATGGVVSILCYIFLIPTLGVMGAVIGSVAFYLVMISMHLIFIRKFGHLSP